jgi:hypothetical protein
VTTKGFEKMYRDQIDTIEPYEWTVRVQEPDAMRGEELAFITIDEENPSQPEQGSDKLFLNLDAAKWLMGTLYEAIQAAEAAEKRVKKSA